MKKEITVLIPTFNRCELLNRAITSLERQDERISIHCVISDNFSSDDTQEMVNSWVNKKRNLKITYTKQDCQIKPLENWKSLLQYIDTDFSKFLFDDDWLEDNALKQMLNDLAELQAKTIIYNTNIFAKTHNYEPINRYYKHNDTQLTIEKVVNSILRIEEALPVTPSAAIQESNSIVNALLFSEINSDCSEQAIGNDLIMNFYSLLKGDKSFFIDKSIVNLWGGEDSITMNTTNSKVLSFCYVTSLIYILDKFDCHITSNQLKTINHKIFANNFRSMFNNEFKKFSLDEKFKPKLSYQELLKYLYRAKT